MSTILTDHTALNANVPGVVSDKVQAVIQKNRLERLFSAGLLTSAALLFIVLVAIGLDWLFVVFDPARRVQITLTACMVLVAAGVGCLIRALWQRLSPREAAWEIDRQFPQLQERWSSVLTFAQPAVEATRRGSESMIQQVTREALHLQQIIQPQRITVGRAGKREWGLLAVACALWLVVLLIDPAHVAVLVRRFFSPTTEISLTQVTSEQGDVIHPLGKPIKLTAQVTGRIPRFSEILIRNAEGTEVSSPLKLLDGAPQRLSFPVEEVSASLLYRFRSGDGQTPWHQITVVDRPVIQTIDLRIIPPAYSKLPEIHFDSLPKTVKALEGSQFQINITSDKPLQSLTLHSDDQHHLELTAQSPQRYQGEMRLEQTWVFSPILISTDGQQNEHPPRCEILVFADQAPAVTVASPGIDIAVRPDDTIPIHFDAKDDLGITAAELVIFEGNTDRELKVIPIPLDDQQGERTVHAQTELNLKELELKQGDQFSFAIRVYDSKDATSTLRPMSTVADQTPPTDSATSAATDTETADKSPDSLSKDETSENSANTTKANSSAETSPNPTNPTDLPTNTATKSSTPAITPSQPQSTNNPTANPPSKQPTKPSSNPPQSPSEPTKSLEGGNTWLPKSENKHPQETQPGDEITGKPRPDYHMEKHELDTPPGQSTSAGRRRITIDEWAGSYASQLLEKLQLQVDPVLEQLKETLRIAQTALKPVSQRANAQQGWQAKDSLEVRRADESLKQADNHILELTLKTDETPYAFIGLQLQDIDQQHIQPARNRLNGVTLLNKTVSTEDLEASLTHIAQALRLLEDLTRQYEVVKLNQKLEDTLTRIEKMHQIFLDGTFALLEAQKPELNPKQREFMELDLSDEFLKQLEDLLKKKLEIQAELARLLSQDPRLLERYMAMTRLESTTLRDQLTVLHQQQAELTQKVKAGLPTEQDPNGQFQLADRKTDRVFEAEQIQNNLATLKDNYRIWMPLDFQIEEEEDLKIFDDKLAKAVARGLKLVEQSAQPDLAPARDTAEELAHMLTEFKETVPELVSGNSHPKLPVHIANRIQETDRLITDVTGWLRKEQSISAGNDYLAAEVLQHRITVDTAELSRKLLSLHAQCQGISPELGELAETFMQTMETDLLPELEQSQVEFNANDVRRALTHQTQSVTFFQQAETELDQVMDALIKHLDALPYNKTPNLPPLESLEDLLAMLENEARAVESLGIPNRPSNLMIERDWSRPGQGGGSRQPGAQMGQARQAQQMAQRLRQQSEAALKKLRGKKGDGVNSAKAVPAERAWDTLGSTLEDHLRQARGNFPPEQYRQAIEQYFESLAGKKAE